MATAIITAIRTRTDLKESLLHTATELAHRSSIYGVVRVSYGYLAQRCHCSRRTVIRHIQQLIDCHLLKKSVVWIKGNYCAVNTYTFTIAWDREPRQGGSDKVTSKFPPQDISHEKFGSLRDTIARLQKGLQFCTPGSEPHEATCAKIAALTGLLRDSHAPRPAPGATP